MSVQQVASAYYQPPANGLIARVSDLIRSAGIPLAVALVAALMIFLARAARERWIYRRGALTGYWLWLTYDPEDSGMRGAVWSIELAELKHRHTTKADKITGTVWRVFDRDVPSHWARRWTLTGWKVDEVVEGVYKWTRERGGSHGVIHVWETDDGFAGQYIRVVRYAHGRRLTHDRVDAWTEWTRLPELSNTALAVAVGRIPPRAAKEYPRRVRRRLGIRTPWLPRFLEGMAYAVAPLDNYFALARASEARRSTQRDPQRDDGPLDIYRADLGLGAQTDVTNLRVVRPDASPAELSAGPNPDDRKAA
jgi:hypothetical protein